ncbi:uncharacterized protein LOC115886173 isoform X2 [Sitophilus oryzae]|uniref:Uncharacterized protein LOC115886173 isoform X2 n=1 Tax=Sitophilus oryzae TaxID=7048 RepID=A0A6J2YCD5_SITOR|nr:uncharacterized protein LOC115886173 isoform X2 [Sitophilus oryzae]
MGKWAKYEKKHKKEWEREALFKDVSSYCKVCETGLRSHKSDLEKHANTSKHKQQACKVDKRQLPLPSFGISVANNSIKKKEIILACYVATHTTIRSVDHLTDIINSFNDNEQTTSFRSQPPRELHLHRTKCSAIIKNVIAPSLLNELIEDVGTSPFSIILDESTDVSTNKLLAIMIKYYSQKRNDVVTQFLSFISVVEATAQVLFEKVCEFFESIKLPLKNLIGLGTDGGSNLCGKNHSLFTLLKTKFELNNLVLVKCICHSLHLCASKASEIFADEIDFLLKETYNWFQNSTLRQSKYKEIFSLINNDSKFTKMTKLSGTRWLSRYRAVEKILAQYLELETFFTINANKERCHSAQLLSNAYKNKTNKVYLTFLCPILKQIYYLNLYFQSANVDFYKAFEDVITTIWSLAGQIIKPLIIIHLDKNLELLSNAMKYDQNFLDLDSCDLGYYFEQEIDAAQLNSEEIIGIKKKCFQFIKDLLTQLINRMPNHLDVFLQIRNFSPGLILNQKRKKFGELPLMYANPGTLTDLEAQYRNILNINWAEIFNGNIPDDAVTFWKKVVTQKNAAGELMFKDLSLLAFTFLSLPSSNAVVERTFSIMNLVKCKIRNQMMLNLLNSIMVIRYYFYVRQICCKSFEPTTDMFSKFNSQVMYNNNKTTPLKLSENVQDSTDDDDIDDVLTFCEQLL